jgi:hypothetical protein
MDEAEAHRVVETRAPGSLHHSRLRSNRNVRFEVTSVCLITGFQQEIVLFCANTLLEAFVLRSETKFALSHLKIETTNS